MHWARLALGVALCEEQWEALPEEKREALARNLAKTRHVSRKVPNHELDFISQACHVLDVPAEHVWCKHMRLEIRPVPLREHSRPIGTEPLPKASSASPGTLRVQPRRQPKEKRTVRDVEDICIFGESARDSLRLVAELLPVQGGPLGDSVVRAPDDEFPKGGHTYLLFYEAAEPVLRQDHLRHFGLEPGDLHPEDGRSQRIFLIAMFLGWRGQWMERFLSQSEVGL